MIKRALLLLLTAALVGPVSGQVVTLSDFGDLTKSLTAVSRSTVALLPSAAAYGGKVILVTDGTGTSDCTIGGGSTSLFCASNGSIWAVRTVGAGGGGSTRTWLYAAQAVCQGSVASAPIWMPTVNAPAYTVCDATHIQGEWILPSTNTTVNWGLGFVVPTGATGAYSLSLVWRTADTTTSHLITFTPSYACVATGANPNAPSFTNLSTFSVNAVSVANTNISSTYSFTPTCAAGSSFQLLLTPTTNTLTSPATFSFQSIAFTANL